MLAPDGVALDITAGECTFCGICADVCPENVFSEPQKMAHVMEISATCLALAGIVCMSCRDACPQDAISMLPQIATPFIPSIDPSFCTSCAACASVCPSSAIHAVEKESADA